MRYLVLFMKGLLMGGADLIPGISGGTVALITGIYEELLKTINSIKTSRKHHDTFHFWRNYSKYRLLQADFLPTKNYMIK